MTKAVLNLFRLVQSTKNTVYLSRFRRPCLLGWNTQWHANRSLNRFLKDRSVTSDVGKGYGMRRQKLQLKSYSASTESCNVDECKRLVKGTAIVRVWKIAILIKTTAYKRGELQDWRKLYNDKLSGWRAPKQGLPSLMFMQDVEDRKRKVTLVLLRGM